MRDSEQMGAIQQESQEIYCILYIYEFIEILLEINHYVVKKIENKRNQTALIKKNNQNTNTEHTKSKATNYLFNYHIYYS